MIVTDAGGALGRLKELGEGELDRASCAIRSSEGVIFLSGFELSICLFLK